VRGQVRIIQIYGNIEKINRLEFYDPIISDIFLTVSAVFKKTANRTFGFFCKANSSAKHYQSV